MQGKIKDKVPQKLMSETLHRNTNRTTISVQICTILFEGEQMINSKSILLNIGSDGIITLINEKPLKIMKPIRVTYANIFRNKNRNVPTIN